jgi:hypothetical protein
VGGGKAGKAEGERSGELTEMNVNGKDVEEDREGLSGSGLEDAGNATKGIILGNSHLGHDRFGVAIVEPYCRAVGEDGENDAKVGLAPVSII